MTEYCIETTDVSNIKTDCIIIGLYDNQLGPSAKIIDSNNQGLISQTITQEHIKGKNAETLLINYLPNNPIKRILLVGFGQQEKLTPRLYRKALVAAITTLKTAKVNSISCTLADMTVKNTDIAWNTQQIVEVFNDGMYQYNKTKSIKKSNNTPKKIHLHTTHTTKTQAQLGLSRGLAIAKAVELTKFLADLPGNICTPTYLAETAKSIANASTKMMLDVLEESDMAVLGMGALLSVSRGSRQSAKLIVLHYNGGKKADKPIVLVGKGLTFDAGGISLKPATNMDEMKYDMCGGASVLGTLQAADTMNLNLNIIGIIASSENMPDGDANKPGDVVTSMSGLTIEVLNTDAEGRLILCDALTYAKKFNPEVVIDLATLTGACLVAFGRITSAILGNDSDLCDDLIVASKTAVDRTWRLPLWEEYHDLLKSNFADLANIGGRNGGTITAACFLSRFTEDYRWAHLDIAGSAWRTGTNKGATGRPVPLLCQYLINRNNG